MDAEGSNELCRVGLELEVRVVFSVYIYSTHIHTYLCISIDRNMYILYIYMAVYM